MPDAELSPVERDVQIGAARLKDHFLNHAELLFRRALAAEPGHHEARRLLGVTLFKLGRQDEGIELLTAVGAEDDLAAARQRAGGEPATFSTEQATHSFRVIDYPYRSEVRYGEGRPSHPGLAQIIGERRQSYRELISEAAQIRDDFDDVPAGGSYDTTTPFWLNTWFPPLDGVILTQMLRKANPSRFVEIGSGVSTKFARRAVARYGLRTKLVSIDPQPRNEVDGLCDQVLRKPLETCRPEMFEDLQPGDIFFLDSSHRSFQGSDVTVFFLDILPRLKPGVIIQIHDIYLPDDYISGHVRRLWNEQYLLATALLFAPNAFEILFPCWFVGQDPDLSQHARDQIAQGPLAGLNLYGASFWLRKV